MCCVIAALFTLGPRAAILFWWLVQPIRWGETFDTFLWPFLGFLFLPWTTLMYVLVYPAGINGFDYVWLGIRHRVRRVQLGRWRMDQPQSVADVRGLTGPRTDATTEAVRRASGDPRAAARRKHGSPACARPRRRHGPPPAGSSRAAVRDLLLHLESVGFDGAPRHLGTDDLGREVLTWIDGDVPLPPYPAWAMTDRALTDLGRLIRRFHEATATFRSTTDDWSTAVG